MLPNLIGLAGFARSGKTTIANVLKGNHGYIEYSFEDIRRLGGVTPRQFMRAIRAEGRGRQDDPYLVTYTMSLTEQVSNLHKNIPFVISDIRFLNEAEAVRKAGGTVIWVSRANVSDGGYASKHGPPVNYCDYIFHNNNPVEHIGADIEKMIQHLSIKRT